MSTQVKHRRGNTTEVENFTPAIGEIIVNTDDSSLVVGDGVTQGGKKVGGKESGLPIFGNTTELKAASLEPGLFAETGGYSAAEPSGKGAGTYLVKSPAQALSDGDTIDGYFNFYIANGNVVILQLDGDIVQATTGGVAAAVGVDQTASVQALNEAALAVFGAGTTVVYEFGVEFAPENLDFKLFNNIWMEHGEGNENNRKVLYPNGNDGSGMEHETIVRQGYNYVADLSDIHNDYDIDIGVGQVKSFRSTLWGSRFNGDAGWQCATDLTAENKKNVGIISNAISRMVISYHQQGQQRLGQREFVDLSVPQTKNELCGSTVIVEDDDTISTMGLRLLNGIDSETAAVTHQKLWQLRLNGDFVLVNDAGTEDILTIDDTGGMASNRIVKQAAATLFYPDFGKILTNPNETLVVTLPPAEIGAQIENVVIFAKTLRILPASGENFRGLANDIWIDSDVQGSRVKFVCVTSGGIWEMEQSGTWTDNS